VDNDDEIDFLHGRIDNLTRMVIHLARESGRYEMADSFQTFHNDSTKELNSMREELSK